MMKRKHGESRQNPSGNHKEQRRGGSGYFLDYKLIPRVRQYLKAHSHKNVNTYVMAEDLQRQYGEYARKKKNAFQRMVVKAYDLIQNEEGPRSDNASRLEEQHMKKRRATSPSCSESDEELIEDIEGDSVESFSPDNEEYVAYQNFNSMNNMMSTLYKNPPSASHTSTAPPPLMNSGADKSASDTFITIDVSSDSDNDVDDTKKKENPTFFIDRGQGKAKRPSKVGSSESDRAIPSHTIPSRPQFGENLLISETNVPYSLISDNISAQARKNNSILTPGNGNRKLTLTTMHHGKYGTVSEESRRRENMISDRTENGISEKSSSSKTPKGKSSKTKKSSKDSEEETRKGPEVQISPVTFKDVGGNDKSLLEICKLLVHMRHPEVYKQLGMSPPRGFLLHGPPGCGKTLLAHAIAGELGLPFIKIAATEVVSGVSGESEEKVRDLFDKALMAAPSILFIDEIDAITPKRETASKDMERRIVAQLLSCMDDLANKTDIHVLVIGATNRPDSLDPALRRAGRFDKEISLGIPDEAARVRILQVLCRSLTLSEDFDFQYLARNTPGYVGADLGALTREAAINAVNRVFQDLQKKETYTMMETTSGSKGKKGGSENSIEIIDRDSSEQMCEKESDVIITSDETQQRPGEESELQSIEKANISVIDNDVEMIGDEIQGGSEKNCAEVISETGPAENIHVEEDTSLHGGSKGSSTDITIELKSVLGWLKEQPPLTESQLRDLCITLRDFKEALKYVQPSAMREGFATVPDVTWEDIGALHSVREDLQLAILAPVRHAEEFSTLGLTKAQGILLAGPPGCGKTLLAKAIANESGINFISVKGPELLNMYVGESERAVRQVFQRARNSAPCVIFFDELDALCPRRSNAGEGGASVRVVNQMLTEMDGLEERKQVFIMGATNRSDIIDPAILRPGRLDKLLYVGMPTPNDRLDILQTITKRGTKPKLSEDVSLEQVAADSRCHGFTGADLAALVREASVFALKAVISNKEAIKVPLQVTKRHFDEAFSKVKPSVTKKEQERYDKLRTTCAVTGSPPSSATTTGT